MPDESFEDRMKVSREIRESLVKANQALKEDKIKEAAQFYKVASELSGKLGHTEIAQDYLNKAKELMAQIGESSASIESKETSLQEIIRIADKAISEGNFMEAAKIYEDAARAHPEDAKRLLSEAIALRRKERDLLVTKKDIIRKADTKQSYEETLAKIKNALENKQYKELVKLYGRAAIFAEKLGKRKEATEFRKAAIEAKRQVSKELKAEPKEGRINLVQEYTNTLKQIKKFLDEKKWQEAADGYKKAAKLAIDLEEFERAKVYQEKAAKLQEQANVIELERQLHQKRKELLEKAQLLDIEKNTEELIQIYEEVLKISKELGIMDQLEEINKTLNDLEKRKHRKKVLIEANEAMKNQDFINALELFQKALRISIDLNETTKVEGFRNIIEELKNKVDKVTRDRRVIEQRAELIAEAKLAIKENPPNIQKAIENYKEAARISIELGEDELANSYLQTAKKMEEDQGLIIERENFVRDAEEAIKEKNYLLAINYYIQAAKFSEKLGEQDLAKRYQKKAKALKELAEEL
ncbi:MAG: hypothetical protein ACTSYB_10175 [Candidatus Helarchaeota archaeon]